MSTVTMHKTKFLNDRERSLDELVSQKMSKSDVVHDLK